MKTKIIALLLALVVMVSMLASCGGFGGGTTTPGGDTTDDDTEGTVPGGNGGNTTTKRPWEKTKLIFEMTENSNNQELSSTCRRYLAGDTSDFKGDEAIHKVDTLVTARNAKAYADANVEIEYSYVDDKPSNNWGQNIERITDQVFAKAANAPDIYCNFVYDIVACSLQGSFANLLSTTMYKDTHALAGSEHNYFAFEDEINLEDDGKDYMTEYMRSLSLSKRKMYCLSSDYFTDMVRAFFVVPVNITMLESLSLPTNEAGEVDPSLDTGHLYNSDRANAATGEAGKDGKFTIDDFYQLVWDGEWTYDTLAAYAGAVYTDSNNNSREDIGDPLGFALATTSGLSASGMLYTTSITIIEHELDTEKADYTYWYPATEPKEGGEKGQYQMVNGGEHKELENFCDAISALFAKDGVIAIDNSADQTGGVGDALLAIRNRFTTNNMLFGGVICLGSLEYDDYQKMSDNEGKGFGVAPVPLYRGAYQNAQGETVVDEYLTQIHNIGRIGAISRTTQKFAQCTAFLDYQCTNSNEILNTYYDFKLQYDVVNADVKGNVEMLQYIRYHVRSSFDKAYEDALGFFYAEGTAGESSKQIWHYMIKDNAYKFTGDDMGAAYDSYAPVKAQRLYDLEYNIFPGLPE